MKDKCTMGANFKFVNLTKKEVVRSGAMDKDGSIRVRGWYTHVENMGPALAHLCMTRWAGDKVAVVCDSWATTADKDLWQRSEKFSLLLAVYSLNQFGTIHVKIHATGMREASL
jgi:hypothetical protein